MGRSTIAFGLLMALVSVARAEPAGYPREAVARPVLLPAGGVEARLALDLDTRMYTPNLLSVGRWEFVTAETGLGYRLGPVELDASAGFSLYETSPSPSSGVTLGESTAVSAVDAAAWIEAGLHTAVGIDLLVHEPGGEYEVLGAQALIVTRHRYGSRGAIQLEGGAAVRHADFDNVMKAEDQLYASADLQLEAQVSPVVAVLALAGMTLDQPIDPAPGDLSRASLGQRYGLRGLVSMSPAFDLELGFDVIASQLDNDAKTFTVAVVARRIP